MEQAQRALEEHLKRIGTIIITQVASKTKTMISKLRQRKVRL